MSLAQRTIGAPLDRGRTILESKVFWPVSRNPYSRLTGTNPFPSSDHRLVWVDVLLSHRR